MSGGTIKSGNLQVGQDGTASNNFTWYQPAVADGTVRLGVGVAGATTSDVVTVTNAGNVGIGTTSPTQVLTVNGRLAFSNLFAASNIDGIFLQSGVGTTVNTATGNNITFNTGTTERMRIDSSGNVLVGTTTSSAKTYVYNNITQFGIGIEHTTASYAALMVANTASSGTRYLVDFRVSGTAGGNQQGTITSTGTNVAYNTSSDYRLKENIAPMTGALDKVAQLKPVTYTWKIDGSNGQGFIAHELQAIVPDAVVGEKDAVDENGKPIYQGVDTSFLVATLTAAIQELKAEIDALKGAN